MTGHQKSTQKDTMDWKSMPKHANPRKKEASNQKLAQKDAKEGHI
jgi:hypothetical protein